MIYLDLFWSFFQIGMLSFGGGMAAISLIQVQVVEVQGWLNLTEFADLITIVEMTPGSTAINAATFVGTQVAGLGGAIIATIGCITPSCIIVLTLAWLYSKYKDIFILKGALHGFRPAVIALIAAAGASILFLALFGEEGISAGIENIDLVSTSLFLIGLTLLRVFRKVNPIKIIIGSGIIGGAIYLHLGIV